MISLALMPSVLEGSGFIRRLPTDTWKRSIRANGGFWQGTLTMQGDLSTLAEMFYTRLGCHVEEKWGGVTSWEGLVYEMDLVHAGVTRRRTLDLMHNYVRSSYIDPNNEVQQTGWTSQAQSIARYGRKEEILKTDQAPQPAAEAYRDRVLYEEAWPWARPVSASRPGDTELTIAVCGYAFTANWRFNTQTSEYDSNQGPLTYAATTFMDTDQDWTDWETTAGDAVYSLWVANDDNTMTWAYLGAKSSTTVATVYQDQALTTAGWNGAGITDKTPSTYYVRGPAHTWVSNIITTDCEFLSAGAIDTNLLQVNRVQSFPTRAWDTMMDVIDMGDTDGNPWRLWVDVGRYANYRQIDTTPRYYLRNGGLYDSMSSRMQIAPWLVRPAVVRDLSFTAGRSEYGSWLDDARDIYIDEVQVDADGDITLKAEYFSEAEIVGSILLAQARYQAPERPKK